MKRTPHAAAAGNNLSLNYELLGCRRNVTRMAARTHAMPSSNSQSTFKLNEKECGRRPLASIPTFIQHDTINISSSSPRLLASFDFLDICTILAQGIAPALFTICFRETAIRRVALAFMPTAVTISTFSLTACTKSVVTVERP
jgi:hypothetical protein